MKLPEIPTDNLYKFMALSGLILVIVSFVPYFHVHKLEVNLISLKGKVETLKTEVEWVSSDLEKLDNEIEGLKVEIAKLTGVSPSEITMAFDSRHPLSDIRKEKKVELEEHSRELDELRAKRSRYVEMKRKQLIKAIQVDTKREEYEHLLSMIRMEVVVALVASLFGVIMMVTGFKLWYTKLQLPQDIIIRKKAKGEQKQ